MTILGICGRCITPNGEACQAGAGKDTLADIWCQQGFGKIALADPLKRICQSVWGFSHQQLWGPSQYRNAPDRRYPIADGKYLTPRAALQSLDGLRVLEQDCWNRICLDTCQSMLEGGGRVYYDPVSGILPANPENQLAGMIITDVRFPREVEYIRSRGGMVVLIERSIEALPDMDTSHTSERGLLSWGHDWFDAVIENHSGPADLAAEAVDFLVSLDLIGRPTA